MSLFHFDMPFTSPVCFRSLTQLVFLNADDKEKESSDAKPQEMEETILKRSKVFRKRRHHKKNWD